MYHLTSVEHLGYDCTLGYDDTLGYDGTLGDDCSLKYDVTLWDGASDRRLVHQKKFLL